VTAKKPAKKPARRKRRVFDGAPACAWAVRRRASKANAFMPGECVIRFAVEPEVALLTQIGWTVSPDADDTVPQDQLEHNLDRIVMDWTEDFGKGWVIEIRPLP